MLLVFIPEVSVLYESFLEVVPDFLFDIAEMDSGKKVVVPSADELQMILMKKKLIKS